MKVNKKECFIYKPGNLRIYNLYSATVMPDQNNCLTNDIEESS